MKQKDIPAHKFTGMEKEKKPNFTLLPEKERAGEKEKKETLKSGD